MKKIISMLLLTTTMVYAQSSVELDIGGMTCGGCSAGINESFKEDFPAYKVHVDYESARMKVQSKDGSDINIKALQEALDEMGFKGTPIQ